MEAIVQPVKFNDGSRGTSIEVCFENEAQCFGVYIRLNDGRAMWIEDYEDKEKATKLAERINFAIKS